MLSHIVSQVLHVSPMMRRVFVFFLFLFLGRVNAVVARAFSDIVWQTPARRP